MNFREIKIKTSNYTYSNAITDGKTCIYQDANKHVMIPLKQANVFQESISISEKLKEELIYFYFSKTIKETIQLELATYQIELDYWLSTLKEHENDSINFQAIKNRIKQLCYLIYEG